VVEGGKMKLLSQIGYWINILVVIIGALYAYIWFSDRIFTKIYNGIRGHKLLLEFAWHHKEFRQWMNETKGPICDACGLRITEAQENVGHECDLHKWCIEKEDNQY
jgi:hypothetical protein